MDTLKFKVTGIDSILLNNPQTVDPFNKYSKAKAIITKKGTRKTEDDQLELRRLEVESKVYFDEKIGIYVPSNWITAAIGGISFTQLKIAKKVIRGCVFPDENKIKLHFEGEEKVKSKADVSGNPAFHILQLVKQGQVRVPKAGPIFKNWSFTTSLSYESEILDRDTLEHLLTYASNYGGWGDFRPTFGRASLEILE